MSPTSSGHDPATAGNTPYDHTSIIATLRKRFRNRRSADRPGAAARTRKPRDACEARQSWPAKINALPYTPSPAERLLPGEPDGMQQALTHFAANANTTGVAFQRDRQPSRSIEAVRPKPLPGNANLDHVSSSAAFVRERMGISFPRIAQ